MIQIIEASAVIALMADMLPWDRETVLDEYRPIDDDDDKGKTCLDDYYSYEVVEHFGGEALLNWIDLDDIITYFKANPDEWKELKMAMELM